MDKRYKVGNRELYVNKCGVQVMKTIEFGKERYYLTCNIGGKEYDLNLEDIVEEQVERISLSDIVDIYNK